MNEIKYCIVEGYVINKENGKIEEICEGYKVGEEYKDSYGNHRFFRDINLDITKKLNIKCSYPNCCLNKDNKIIGSIIYCYPSYETGTMCKIVKLRYKMYNELEYMVRVGCGNI